MKNKTALREMPPWFIEKNIGIQHFKDDISLTDDEIATFGAWADAGAPRGDLADLPPPIEWADADEWTIGTPDLIVSTPVMTVPAVAPDYHDEIGPVPTGLTADRWVKAVEVKEVRLLDDAAREQARSLGGFGNFTIHHMGIHSGEALGTREESERPLEARDRFRLTHEIGQNATIYPADTGVKLAAGTELNFTIHLYSSGMEIPVRADIGFTFHPQDFEPKYSQSGFLAIGHLGDGLDIPAGADNVRFDSFYTMPQHGILTTYEPHMHSSGKRMCVEAVYPNQTREMLKLLEVRPQLGAGLRLRGRPRADPAAGHGAAHDRLVRQHRREPQRGGSAQLEGLGQPLDRRHVPAAAEGDLPRRGAVTRRSWPSARCCAPRPPTSRTEEGQRRPASVRASRRAARRRRAPSRRARPLRSRAS